MSDDLEWFAQFWGEPGATTSIRGRLDPRASKEFMARLGEEISRFDRQV